MVPRLLDDMLEAVQPKTLTTNVQCARNSRCSRGGSHISPTPCKPRRSRALPSRAAAEREPNFGVNHAFNGVVVPSAATGDVVWVGFSQPCSLDGRTASTRALKQCHGTNRPFVEFERVIVILPSSVHGTIERDVRDAACTERLPPSSCPTRLRVIPASHERRFGDMNGRRIVDWERRR
jgi:hypothetical protein